ncbi:hypothetical protein HELRODRAFT_181073 [Helobdella robusta]|uniref:Methyltransferase domain-containing protein n=1 Tax=Helobdella robusta TaxID=6412 RepID=T1FGK9_HELRO|nr:hypothetical protein HELRODRAFT_181073 [Helobdella robusta]ESN93327.1 hypothetical protein HELRODRAFT_181073 [Helobdella robusta]
MFDIGKKITSKSRNYKDFLLQWKRITKLSYEKIKVLHESLQNDLKLGKAFLMDSKLWMGLNGKEVYSRYPGIIFLDSYKGPKLILDEFNVKGITEASLDTLEMVYEKMITSIHVLCLNMTRYGNIDDGGWEVCTSQPYNLQEGCSVFSFGINFDFSFDDDIGISNNCSVFSFDPSMSSEDHVRSDNVYFYQIGLGPLNSVTRDRWIVKSFRSIIEILQIPNNVIDVLKIDIEYDEWDSLRMMINDGSLLNVKQLLFEVDYDIEMLEGENLVNANKYLDPKKY